jgi:hypothetical protein
MMRSFLPDFRTSVTFVLAASAALTIGCAGSSSNQNDAPTTLTLGQRATQLAGACLAACNAEATCFSDSTERAQACVADCRSRFDELEVDAPSVRACLDLAEAELRCMAALTCPDIRTYYQAESGDDYPCAAEDQAWSEACAE